MKLHEVTQRMLEKYEQALHDNAEKAEELHSVARYNRCIIESAIKTGMAEMEDDFPTDLLDVPVWKVQELSLEIVKHVAAAKAPPDPN